MKPSRVLATAAGISVVVALGAASAHADPVTPDSENTVESDFYVNPDSNAFAWLADNPDSPHADLIRTELAEVPTANWYGDWDNTPVGEYAADAAAAGKMPIVVAYNIYERDCWGHSQGGAPTPEAYRAWVDDFSASLGDAEAIVIVEPDALAHVDDGCLEERQTRLDLLEYAVDVFAGNENADVYLDAGNYTWPSSPETVAGHLSDVGVDRIRGFSLNVSNYYTTAETEAKAAEINAALGKPVGFVVDTSRNGSGRTDDGEDGWCNPVGATLGAHPAYADGPADAHLWLKVPGDSDGECNYDESTPAGHFSQKLATALITGEYT
ncbi:MAG TPA: glycoside hydrolase family 6 protein [Candidatus Stackebrandtia excrementipullorum]|nr:glycoside hydrolase family 6 protein [Candidatus Stackebrandtia excrementipullorum]